LRFSSAVLATFKGVNEGKENENEQDGGAFDGECCVEREHLRCRLRLFNILDDELADVFAVGLMLGARPFSCELVETALHFYAGVFGSGSVCRFGAFSHLIYNV